MKLWRKFVVFVIIGLFVQLFFLLYLNNYKLKSLNFFNSDDIKSKHKEENTLKVLVPNNVDEIKSSYNGKYSSYYNNYNLFVINTQTGIRRKLEFDNSVINIYKWHPNKNKLVVAQQSLREGGSSLKLVAYDADLEARNDVKDLSWLGSNITVEDLDFIGEGDLVVKIVYTNGDSEIYFIGDEVNKLSTVTKNIGYIKYTGQEDKILYEDKKSGKYYITGSKKEVNRDKLEGKVINIDTEGNIYMAEEEQDKVSSIYYKNLFEDKSSWQPIEIEPATSVDNIIVDSQGSIYINNPQSKELINLRENTSYMYEGKLMSVYKEGIFVINDNSLIKIQFKDLKNNEGK